MPQLSLVNRRAAIESELQEVGTEAERHRIPWKGDYELCPVIVLSLEAVVLNPRSHRLRAQLASHTDRDAVELDPHGAEAQGLLTTLLREAEGYEDLKANIGEEGQHNPGVVTRAGLLVNGNRRAVALRDLGDQYIPVAVLPRHTNERQIAELELKLQMTKEFKEDYSFTNQLLFVEELRTDYNYTSEQIALLLRYAQSSDPKHVKRGIGEVERATRLLAMIREIQDLSGNRINYVHFDDQHVSMQELDAAYEKLRIKNPQAAERLRSTRFLGIVLESGYKVLREMNEVFLEDYFWPALEDNDELADLFPITDIYGAIDTVEESQDPHLELLGPQGDATTDAVEPDARSFVQWIASLDEYVERPSSGDVRLEIGRRQIRQCIGDSLAFAAEQSRLDGKRESRLDAPLNRVKEATAKVKRARKLLLESVKPDELDANDFRYKLRKLEKAVRNLRDTFGISRNER